MKCIERAMSETEKRPRAGWWGFVARETGHRYLMRYHHCFAIFSGGQVLHATWKTITDKRGVEDALRIFEERKRESEETDAQL
jgi:hypothetical protein